VPLPLVDALRALGHDVLTARDDGRANLKIPDPDVLVRAISLGRAVLTNNRNHFHKLHRALPNHVGIVTFKDDQDDRPALAARIDAAVTPLPNLVGLLVKVVRPNTPRKPKQP